MMPSESPQPRGNARDNLLKHSTDLFADEVGQLNCKYQIKVDATVDLVQHPPCRVPVALRDRLKAELDCMV